MRKVQMCAVLQQRLLDSALESPQEVDLVPPSISSCCSNQERNGSTRRQKRVRINCSKEEGGRWQSFHLRLIYNPAGAKAEWCLRRGVFVRAPVSSRSHDAQVKFLLRCTLQTVLKSFSRTRHLTGSETSLRHSTWSTANMVP
jgi:hypothetical protein